MSVFLEILRCILCFDDEESETRGRNRRDTVNNSRYTHLIRESDSQTQIHSPNYFKSRNSSITPPVSNFVKPNSTAESRTLHKNPSVAIKPETGIRTPHKSLEGTQKPNILPPSPPPYPTQCYQHKAINSTNQRLPQPSPSLSKPSSLSKTPPPSVSSSSSSSSKTPPSFPKPLQTSTKPALCLAPSTPTKSRAKNNYIWVEKGASPVCAIPDDLKDLFKKDVVPGVLKKPLSPSTYKDFFDALLFAEDFYIEKWDGFKMENVTLELHEAAIYKRKGKYNNLNVNYEKDDKVFVAFEIDSIPERRPFLLSRHFVSVQPSGKKAELFQGLIYRVVKSNLVLVEFGEDFHYQHYSAC
ncbi:uncharacterized protein LOC130765698 [Actinidia eriantha]|uniref:uncharacterized protein LOC130765698 n=1 Tax=Actinidia eriantha TaxID=165200 RepID=UPI002589DCCB|nr:uncharacterized protein LOC130765698 [Actinidia eriantha]